MSLLPPNATRLERALEQGAQLDPIGTGAEGIDDPTAAPLEALPWLAWGLSVDNWDPNWPEAVKRQAIADSIEDHRRKGTRASVETVLARMDDLCTVVEWHEAQPRRDPHTFEIHVQLVRDAGALGGRRASAAFVADIIREVGRVKPLREHLRVVQSVVLEGGLGVQGAARLAHWRRDDADFDTAPSPAWEFYLQTEQGEPIQAETGTLLDTAL